MSMPPAFLGDVKDNRAGSAEREDTWMNAIHSHRHRATVEHDSTMVRSEDCSLNLTHGASPLLHISSLLSMELSKARLSFALGPPSQRGLGVSGHSGDGAGS
jgi:hypothetical protein